MIPRPPLFALRIPFLCPPLLFSPFPLFSFSLRIVPGNMWHLLHQ